MISEHFFCDSIAPHVLDTLLAQAWRHFGNYFFRYSTIEQNGTINTVTPLRIHLADFHLSRSQKRILRRNRDLTVQIAPATLTPEKEALFDEHKTRFQENVPPSLLEFIGERPSGIPCNTAEIALSLGDELVAVTFLDIGEHSTSSIYSIFHPRESRRSLGIYLLLLSIRFSIASGCVYHHLGYAYREPSVYDYKKKFSGLEVFNWEAWETLRP